jgi:uncharacterized protein YdhG (YjbR/CyaY superfamily)
MATKPKTINDYLDGLNSGQREALEKLRRAIKAAAPDAEECISYGIPAFRYMGMLVGFGAAANHCSFFLMSGTTVTEHQDLLKNYDASKGTIRFSPARPLPVTLVKKLVKARMAENKTRHGRKK